MKKSLPLLIAIITCLTYSTYHFYTLERDSSKKLLGMKNQNIELSSNMKALESDLKKQLSELIEETRLTRP